MGTGGGGGINGLKNLSGKCKGRGGGQLDKEPKWAMGRTGRGGAQRVHYAPSSH
jgi:hypothetical protein